MKFFFIKLIFFFLFTGLAIANENIRFININYIINNSEVGKNLNKLIEDKNKQIKSELNKISEKLEKDKNKIVNQKNVLKKEEFDKLAKNYDDKLKKFNQTRKTRMAEFNQFRINSKKKIIDTLNPIITKYVDENEISLVIPKKNIIIGKKNLDITNEIIKLLNNKIKSLDF